MSNKKVIPAMLYKNRIPAMLKKIICFCIVGLISFNSAINYAAEDYDIIYQKAMEYITDYELEAGLQEIKKITFSIEAPADLLTKSYFWVAFIELSKGMVVEANETIKLMLERGLGIEYDIKTLPKELYQNIQLIRIFDERRSEFLRKREKLPKKAAKHLRRAQKLYRESKIDKAKEELDLIEIKDQEIMKLENKIDKIKKERIKVRKKLESKLYSEAVVLYKFGHILESLYKAKQILRLNPENYDAYLLFREADKNIQKVTEKMNERDKKKFQRAIDCYLGEKFNISAKIFRNLELFLPEVDMFLSQSIVRMADEKNIARANKYFKEAVRDKEKSKYERANEKLLLALQLNEYYLKALILLEEVKIELEE